MTRPDLAETIALVPQTPFLIADTVFHNICYGMRRKVSLEEVKEAARKANLESVIERLPGKYDFFISEEEAICLADRGRELPLPGFF